MVYNFRVAEITRENIFEKSHPDKKKYLILLNFYELEKKYNGFSERFYGAMGSYIYDFSNSYLRIDSAFSKIKEKNAENVTEFTGTKTDDLLFTIGHSLKLSDKSLITISGLTGIPTHEILSLNSVEFGYGQYSLGTQIDGAYHHLNKKNAFLYGLRYIRFFPRTVFVDRYEKDFKFNISNMFDIFLSDRRYWGNRKHTLEIGYTFRARFGAKILPNINQIIEKTNYNRSIFFAAYKYKFLVKKIHNKILIEFSYGFDHIPKKFGNKHIIHTWLAWILNF